MKIRANINNKFTRTTKSGSSFMCTSINRFKEYLENDYFITYMKIPKFIYPCIIITYNEINTSYITEKSYPIEDINKLPFQTEHIIWNLYEPK